MSLFFMCLTAVRVWPLSLRRAWASISTGGETCASLVVGRRWFCSVTDASMESWNRVISGRNEELFSTRAVLGTEVTARLGGRPLVQLPASADVCRIARWPGEQGWRFGHVQVSFSRSVYSLNKSNKDTRLPCHLRVWRRTGCGHCPRTRRWSR